MTAGSHKPKPAEPRQITLRQWQTLYRRLEDSGFAQPSYGGCLGRHVADGDTRLLKLMFDNSPAALRLWNFLLTEEQRLRQAAAEGKKIVGAMKDLGTVPVMAYSLDNVVAFYPDGAWWIPCIMELGAGLLEIADSLGIDESFCPVRAMLGAFVTKEHFPIPQLLICSAGATCDDFSAIAQRLSDMGYPIIWWEIPHRRRPEPDELSVELPGGFIAARAQVDFVKGQLRIVSRAIEKLSGQKLTDARLAEGIKQANRIRSLLRRLRRLAFTADPAPIGALEILIAEMLAIHFCSDRDETIAVLRQLTEEVQARVDNDSGVLDRGAARIFWVNPVADLMAMNLLEGAGGRLCGTEFLFSHAIDAIPEDIEPLEALARMALADPMTGSAADRADRICRDILEFGSEAVLISRIPGASHCAVEGAIISRIIRRRLGVSVLEIEVPPVIDAIIPALQNRLEALVETVLQRRRQ